jgi:hypothetical protein
LSDGFAILEEWRAGIQESRVRHKDLFISFGHHSILSRLKITPLFQFIDVGCGRPFEIDARPKKRRNVVSHLVIFQVTRKNLVFRCQQSSFGVVETSTITGRYL